MNIPDYCYALNNMTIDPKTKIGKAIKIKALETGYYKTTMTATQEEIDLMNEDLDCGCVDIPTARAMESASMFGWDCYNGILESYKKVYGEK